VAYIVVSVHTGREADVAAEIVERLACGVYIPQCWDQSRRGLGRLRIARMRMAPLLPGYMFVADPGHSWPRLRHPRLCELGLDGVLRAVGMDRPATVDDAVIDEMRLRERAGGGAIRLGKPHPHGLQYRRGERVVFTEDAGSYQSLDGLFDGDAGARTAFVLTMLFGREVRHAVPYRWIRPRSATS
jgi:hypothetical protein